MSPSLPPAPSFSTAQVAHVAGVALDTLLTWIKRGNIELMETEMPGRGREREFSLHRLLHIALVARLAKGGMEVKPASAAALSWSDAGNPHRIPGGLFQTGRTLFVVHHGVGSPDFPPTRIVNVNGKDPAVSVLAKLFRNPEGDVKSITVVDLNDLHQQARQKLGL